MEMEIKMKKLGFGTMRLPVLNQEEDGKCDGDDGIYGSNFVKFEWHAYE